MIEMEVIVDLSTTIYEYYHCTCSDLPGLPELLGANLLQHLLVFQLVVLQRVFLHSLKIVGFPFLCIRHIISLFQSMGVHFCAND